MVYAVRGIGQEEKLCWLACAQMMWEWKHGPGSSWTALSAEIVSRTGLRGLKPLEMDLYVFRRLGIRSLTSPKGANLRHALKWSPAVIAAWVPGKPEAHAQVVVGHDAGKYTIIDPGGALVFSESGGAVNEPRTVRRAEQDLDRVLGPFLWYW